MSPNKWRFKKSIVHRNVSCIFHIDKISFFLKRGNIVIALYFAMRTVSQYMSYRYTDYTNTQCDVKAMMDEADETVLVEGKCKYTKLPDGSTSKNAVLCTLCRNDFAYHSSTSPLDHHLIAKHVGTKAQLSNINFADTDDNIANTSKNSHQSTLNHKSGFR